MKLVDFAILNNSPELNKINVFIKNNLGKYSIEIHTEF